MAYELKDLIVDRVDLVDEGANSAAFIELYKRKENGKQMSYEEILSKMKPEHAEVIQQVIDNNTAELNKAREDLQSANKALGEANEELKTLKAKYCECDGEEDDNGMCKACGKPKKKACGTKKAAAFDEVETLKSMPEAAREMFLKMRAQKEAAEEQIRKAAEEKAEAEAVAKAATMKSLPIEQSKLVDILKGCSPEVTDLLLAASKAIDATVLEEVGKNAGNGASTTNEDAWSKLEKKAREIAERDSVTVEKAMSRALSENPDLYREYLNGGAN